jgi:hypothetical protein
MEEEEVASEEMKHVGASDEHEETVIRDIQPFISRHIRKLTEILWVFLELTPRNSTVCHS